MIAPEKAKQAFDWPPGFVDWPIYISSAAIKQLRQFRRGEGTFKVIQEKITQLSQGLFSGSNQKRLEGVPSDVPIFEAKTTGDLRLIYRIDIDTDHYLKTDKQVIRIHGVYAHNQFDHRLWSRIARSSPRGDKEYRRMVNYRMEPRKRGARINFVTPPMTWPHEGRALVERLPVSNANALLTEDECIELHKIWSLAKFVPYSTAVLASIIEDIDTEHEFSVSPAEGKIIQHMSSCFVIGRSGTGKTTTMLFKLLLWEKAQRSNLLDRPGPIRQMFLTQSHVLASKVEEDYQKLFVAARIGTASGSKGRSRTRLAERHITELDEEAHVDHSGLPEKFSDLKDEHFPLFLTYEQLRRMLENEYGIQSSTSLSQCSRKDARSASSKHVPLLELDDDSWDPFGPPQKGYRDYDKNVTFDLFKSQYWIHFDQQKIKGLDPAQVYSEIMGIICGGEHTLKMPSGYMSRESYVSLSHRSYPSFAAERSRVYDVFEKYLKLKMHNRAFDNPERTHIILKHIDKAIMNIDFLYVDEVQDLLMIDAKLLRDLCPNPHGHFRGGDTAQAISVGSSFRFEDLGALVYREERSNSSVTSGARGPIKPTIFELPVYYRSHQGIVACAASIVDLITALFPYSIDKLRREESIAPGPNPCIFRDERVRWNNFLSDGKRASRAIIVRDDTTRDEVQAELGSTHYMIYTLLESKGLEFDDVLVYNFFASSPASSAQWRAVLGLQRADTTRYRVLETELKRLYVALTRARLHIWIWDSSPTADPMLNYWLSKDLVEICHPSKPFPQLDATPSTTDEWNDMARTLFSKFLYTQAASCFNKAGRKDDHDIALAYQQRKDARAISKNDKRIAAFRDAGAAFRACAEASSAGTRALRRNAAGCFVLSKEFKDAAKEFEEALEYTDAAINYHRAELLEDVARLVRPPDGSISLVTRRTREGLLDNIRIQYLRAGDLKHAELLFDHVEDEISFVEDYLSNSSYLIASIHERRRAFMSAARIYSSIGQDMKAASCWARSDSPARAASSLLDAMWNVAFNIADLEHHRATLNNIPSNSLAEATRMEVEMFRAIIGRNASALCSLGRSFVAKRSTAGAILSFKHALKHDLDFDNEDLSGLFSKLSNVESYCRQLIALLRDRRLCSNPTAQKLAGFHPAIGQAGEHVPDEFCALPNSYAKGLVEQAPPSRPVKILSKMKDGSVHVKGEDLYLLLRHNLEAEMEELLVRVHSKLLRASILHLCLEHLLQVDCGKKISSCRKLHLEAGSQDMLGLYFRVHMQIVTTLDCLWHLPTVAPYDVYAKVRRKWLKQIFTVLFPVTRMLGNHTILDLRRLEAHRAMPIVQNWIEHRIRGINASKEHPLSPDSHFATNAVMLLLMAHFFHGGRLPRYLWYGLKLYYRHDELEDHQTGSSVIHDLTWMLVCDSQVPVDNGVRFLRWVVEKKPPIDLNVLVHFLEILCIQLVFQCSSRRPRPLHNLLLPRSWAIRVLDMFSDNPPTIFRIRELLTPIIEILHNISGWDGSGVFTLHGNAFPRSWPLRQEMIVRICRALVIGESHL
ncbi:uncharacterized protein EI90DRAFT_93924 [Cantharellus anzutake]|uniref:uncharacterized protein n=1 Tax=Cantharellus anzutake TaxID=1750568 RepID=UPI001907FE88|nr:uncharacterized protein EI90DRAFT_93924 [Cantharellus anzutake]KAF8336964.1 hypothetical protein EI90DRAFT_93924 [Cantharellus anzutake]